MKLKKRILSLILALTLCLSLSANAFAAETSNVPEVKKETVTFTLDSGESTTAVQPRMWEQESHYINSNSTTYTVKFAIPNKYFAYEVSATDSNGNACSAIYSVNLLYQPTLSVIATNSGLTANGSSSKIDWITVSAGSDYLFKLCNSSNITLKINITYYSWA